MKSFVFLFIFAISFHISSLFAKTFHLLIMGNTQDPKIKVGVYKDIQNIEESFSYLATACNISLKTKKLTMHDGSLTRKNIVKWIHKEVVDPDDVIILYFSGHGTREAHGDYSIWPRGCLVFDEKDKYNQNVQFSLIIEKLFSKKAALCLVLLDCCNTPSAPYIIPKDFPSTSHNEFDLQKYKSQNITSTGFQELFSKKYGLIIASAASPGQVAWSCVNNNSPNEIGGVFTNIFLNIFFQALQSTKPHWQNIFMKISEHCYEETQKDKYKLQNGLKIPQTPQHRIFLYKHRRSPRVYKKNLFRGCEVPLTKDMNISIFSMIPQGEDNESDTYELQTSEVVEIDSEIIGDEDLVAISDY